MTGAGASLSFEEFERAAGREHASRSGNGADRSQSSSQRIPWAHFDFVPIGAASGLEPLDWLIDGYLEASSLVVLYGPSGSTKTFIALHMALAIAADRPFFSQAVRQGTVLYIAAEGRRGLGRRHAAWCIVNDISPAEREHIPLLRSTAAGRVMDPAFMKRLVALIEAMSVRPVLIVFDTVSKTFGLQKEDNESISAALAILQIELIDRFGCAVLALHHTGKDATRGVRGGSSLEADADAMYEAAIERPKTDDDDDVELGGSRFDYRRDKVRLVCRKMKDAEPAADMLGARLVEIGTDVRGKTITSLALVPGLTPEDHKLIDLLLHGVSIREIAAASPSPPLPAARRSTPPWVLSDDPGFVPAARGTRGHSACPAWDELARDKTSNGAGKPNKISSPLSHASCTDLLGHPAPTVSRSTPL